MSAYGNKEITLIEPRTGADMDPSREERDEIKVTASLRRMSATNAITVLARLSVRAYSCRFAQPAQLDKAIKPGWAIRDAEGTEYQVIDARRERDMWHLIVEMV